MTLRHIALFGIALTSACAPALPTRVASPSAASPKIRESVMVVVSAPPSDPRLSEIWQAASDRLDTQQDVWFEEGDFPAVIQSLKVQASIRTNDYEVWTNLGWMQENVEDYEDALGTYRLYNRQNPTDPDRALPEATFYDRKRMYDKVPPILAGAVSDKSHPNNFRMLARAYERTSRLKESQRVWQWYLKLHPNDGAAKNNLSRVERKLASAP
jgi:cytochrome c-type biogenesis protein CcmH/NrfG